MDHKRVAKSCCGPTAIIAAIAWSAREGSCLGVNDIQFRHPRMASSGDDEGDQCHQGNGSCRQRMHSDV